MNDAKTPPILKLRPPLRRLAGPLGMLVVLTALAGCAVGPRLLRTDVTTFNDWASLPTSKTYVFSRTLEFQNSLEVKAYEDVVRDELALQGFTQVAEPAAADLVVTLRPTVTGARLQLGSPFFDPFNDYPRYAARGYGWYGLRNPGWYGTGWSAYGGYGAGFGGGFGNYAVDLYQRRLEMDIDSRSQPGKRYYEGKVENSGDSETMTGVMPYLVRALFADFPGNNAQTRRVDVPIPLPAPRS